MKHVFIINQISGQGDALKSRSLIADYCRTHDLDHEIILTEYPQHAQKIASEYHTKAVTVYAVGGDGTIFEVLNGLNDDATMGIIPLGSGNDFYRMIGKVDDLNALIAKTVEGTVQAIDYGICDDFKFMNVCSFGIDASINQDASAMIRKEALSKKGAYNLAIVKNVLFNLNYQHYRITADEKIIEGDYYIVAILNGCYYGNGIMANPEGIINDGYLNLCLVKKCPLYKIVPFLLKYLKGKHLNDPLFQMIKAKDINIICDKELPFEADGENMLKSSAHITIKEKGLKLKYPDNKKQ